MLMFVCFTGAVSAAPSNSVPLSVLSKMKLGSKMRSGLQQKIRQNVVNSGGFRQLFVWETAIDRNTYESLIL